MPAKSLNNLRYNMELFRKQMRTYYLMTLFFSSLSIAMVIIGLIIGINSTNGASRVDLVCLNGEEWAPTSKFGTIYLFLISMMILTQINAAQYLTIRIPYTDGIFDSETAQNLKLSLLSKMAVKGSDNDQLIGSLLKRTNTTERLRI
jgi:hypothetical protein